MKKVVISILTLSALASLGLGVATASATNSSEVKADEPVVTEAEHPTLYINELVYRGGESATWNSSNNQVALGGGGRGFEYDAPTNAVIKATYVQSSASWAAWSYIHIRATDNDNKPNNGFTNKGYWLKWAGDGRIWFYKDGTKISTLGADSARNYTSGKTFETEFSAIDMSDGSVQVKFVVDGNTLIDYNDAENPILDGTVYAGMTESTNFSVTGCSLALPSLKSLSRPTIHNASGIVYEEVSFAGSGSGASYHYEARGSQGVSFPFRIDSAGGSGGMAIGAKADVISGQTPCYYLGFEQWGTLTLYRGKAESPYYDTLKTGASISLSPGAKYESTIGMKMTDFGGGDTCVTVWLGGTIIYNCWDKKTEENTPITCNPIDAEGEDAITYVNMWTSWMSWTVVDPDKKAVDDFVATYITAPGAEDYTEVSEADRNSVCRGKHTAAITAFNNDEILNDTQRSMFTSGSIYVSARSTLDYWDTHSTPSNSLMGLQRGLSDPQTALMVAMASLAGALIALSGCFLCLRKRKGN